MINFYRGNEDFIEFSDDIDENPFGAVLLALCEENFDTLPEAVVAITDSLEEGGFDVDDDIVIGLLTGDILPSQELVEVVSVLAGDEDTEELLWDAAVLSYELAEADPEEVYDQIVDYGFEDEEDYSEEDFPVTDDEEGEYLTEDPDYEEDYGYDEDYVDETLSEVSEVAEQLYSRQVITDLLADYQDAADEMMQTGTGLMTPQIKHLLFGREGRNQYLEFSRDIEDSGLDPETYLTCIEFSLNLLSELGSPDGYYFSSQTEEDILEGPTYNFSRDDSSVEQEAREMLRDLGL